MSSQSSTSSLESLNESSSTKYGLEPYMYEPTIRTKRIYICYDSSEISMEDNSDKELNTRTVLEIQTGVCGNCSKMVASTEGFRCREMLEISDERFNGIYNCLFHFLYDL